MIGNCEKDTIYEWLAHLECGEVEIEKSFRRALV